MQGQSHHVKTVLERQDARNKTFLALKDSHGNPLGRSPWVCNYSSEKLTFGYLQIVHSASQISLTWLGLAKKLVLHDSVVALGTDRRENVGFQAVSFSHEWKVP